MDFRIFELLENTFGWFPTSFWLKVWRKKAVQNCFRDEILLGVSTCEGATMNESAGNEDFSYSSAWVCEVEHEKLAAERGHSSFIHVDRHHICYHIDAINSTLAIRCAFSHASSVHWNGNGEVKTNLEICRMVNTRSRFQQAFPSLSFVKNESATKEVTLRWTYPFSVLSLFSVRNINWWHVFRAIQCWIHGAPCTLPIKRTYPSSAPVR